MTTTDRLKRGSPTPPVPVLNGNKPQVNAKVPQWLHERVPQDDTGLLREAILAAPPAHQLKEPDGYAEGAYTVSCRMPWEVFEEFEEKRMGLPRGQYLRMVVNWEWGET